MLIFVVVIFLVCWGPRLVMNVIIKFGLHSYTQFTYTARVACYLLSFIHSAANPFVYGLMSSNFRRRLCRSCGRGGSKLVAGGAGGLRTKFEGRSGHRCPDHSMAVFEHNSGVHGVEDETGGTLNRHDERGQVAGNGGTTVVITVVMTDLSGRGQVSSVSDHEQLDELGSEVNQLDTSHV